MNQQQANKTNNISNNQTDKSTKKKLMKNVYLDIYEIYIIDLVEQSIKGPTITENNKETQQRNRSENKKNSKEKKGNIAIVTFSKKYSA